MVVELELAPLCWLACWLVVKWEGSLPVFCGVGGGRASVWLVVVGLSLFGTVVVVGRMPLGIEGEAAWVMSVSGGLMSVSGGLMLTSLLDVFGFGVVRSVGSGGSVVLDCWYLCVGG